MYIRKTYANLEQRQSPKPEIKKWFAKIFTNKETNKEIGDLQNTPKWVQWIHKSMGVTHCSTCLKLDKCWFNENNAPPCPHHPNCHCYFEDVPFEKVKNKANSYSKYSKFDPYLFNTKNEYSHNKEKLFLSWGYTVEDAKWLQAEIERQGQEKYISGDYELGKLDHNGQRINIRVTIPRRDKIGKVSFITGWMVYPNGQIKLATPYGDK